MLTPTEKRALTTLLSNQGLILGLVGQLATSLAVFPTGRDQKAFESRILAFIDQTKEIVEQLARENQ